MMPKQTVLLVDDNRILCKAVVRYLIKEGFHVINVDTVTQARDAVIASNPSVLLLDIQLPDRTSLALVEELSARGIPVIAITADDHSYGERRLLMLGAAAYLVKPFPLTRLVRVLRGVLPSASCPSNLPVNSDSSI